jgi:NAD(P)-dependent dehydrogenase (short-subunit alcohol dehydrogenase family)
MSGRVSGKAALVTGGAGGLGYAIGLKLAQEGAKVLLTDLDGERAAAAAEAINDIVGAGTAFSCRHDVTSEADWQAAMNTAQEKLGGLSILVNNAGIGVNGNVEEVSLEDWHKCFAVNSDGVFLGCKYAMPLLRESQPASIVNISSIAALIASHEMPAYNASKAACWMLTKSVALHATRNKWDIRCNSLHPCFVDTPILDGFGKVTRSPMDVVKSKLARQIPVGRIGEPEEVADAVLYMASDESRFMTGSELKLDGGISAM